MDRTGPIAVPDTGGWQTFRNVTRAINLGAGTQVLRLVFDANGATGGVGNFNALTISGGPTPPTMSATH